MCIPVTLSMLRTCLLVQEYRPLCSELSGFDCVSEDYFPDFLPH
jgi:hypothetical protein